MTRYIHQAGLNLTRDTPAYPPSQEGMGLKANATHHSWPLILITFIYLFILKEASVPRCMWVLEIQLGVKLDGKPLYPLSRLSLADARVVC